MNIGLSSENSIQNDDILRCRDENVQHLLGE